MSSQWQKTQFANLRKFVSSGVYFVKAKVRGRVIRKSLKTKSLEIAKAKLDVLLAEERARLPERDEDWTFKQLIEAYNAEIDGNYMLEPRSKEYRKETAKMIQNTWPGLDDISPRKLSADDIKEWSRKVVKRYAPSRFNGAVETFRAILKLGMERGIVGENVAMQIKRVSVPVKPPSLPSSEEFHEVLKVLDSHPLRADAAKLVRFLAYTGLRVGAVPKVYPSNIDLERNEFILPPIKRQKTEVRMPMIPELRSLAQQLLAEHQGDGPLFAIANPRRALPTACKKLGISRLTPHKLRHLFATLPRIRG